MSNITSAVGAGMGAGFDINAVIDATMAAERAPINLLSKKQAAIRSEMTAVAAVKNRMESLKAAAKSLDTTAGIHLYTGTSSDEATAVVTATGSQVDTASLSFRVTQVASTHLFRSLGTASSKTLAGGATSETKLALLRGAGSLGVSSVRSGANAALGDLSLRVSRPTVKAVLAGGNLSSSNVVDGSNDTLALTVNGEAKNVAIAHGTYDRAALITAVDAALAAAGGAGASASGTSISIATTREGSNATLSVTGGSALSLLSLTQGSAAGVDGELYVGETRYAVASAGAGESLVAGAHTVAFAGGLRLGKATGTVVSTGDGSLSSVVSAINATSVGVRASVVGVGAGSRLQLQSDKSGVDYALNVDGSVFDGVGGMVQAQGAADATLTIGEGAGAYSLSDSDGVFSSLAEGWTVTAKKVSATPVTLSVARDSAAVADKMEQLVKAANDVLKEIKTQTFVSTAKGGNRGALAGDATIKSIAASIRSAFSGGVGRSNVPGLNFARDGVLEFDKAVFKTKYESDPVAVSSALSKAGTSTGAGISFESATADTRAGTYNVTVSSLGTAATSGVLFSGGASSSSTIGVRSGTLIGLYAVRNGDTAASIAAGVNEALEASGITARASVSGGGVVISSESPGANSSFELTSDYGTAAFSTFSGTNPTGTIDGVAATGSGRYLSLPTDSTSNAKGLKLSLGSSTDASGSISYYGGTAGVVAALATRLLTSGNGTLAVSSTSRESRISTYDKQITRLEARMTLREGALRRQYSQLDSIMGGLKGQQSWMTNQISSMNKG